MNHIDLLLIILLAWSAYKGFSKGLIIQAASLVALLLGVLGAIKFSGFTSTILVEEFEVTSRYLPIISFAITFIGIVIGIHLLAKIIDKLASTIALGFINRLLGVVFGVAKTAFIISIILVIINGIDKKIRFLPHDSIDKSFLYKPLSKLAPLIFPYLNFEDLKKDAEEKIEKTKPFIIET